MRRMLLRPAAWFNQHSEYWRRGCLITLPSSCMNHVWRHEPAPDHGETPRVNPEANPLTTLATCCAPRDSTCQPATRCLGGRERWCHDLLDGRSARTPGCPLVTAGYPRWLPDRARTGHAGHRAAPGRWSPCQTSPFPDRRQIREPEEGVKEVFACTLARHLDRWRLPCVHRPT
jgi:hypothetical protein